MLARLGAARVDPWARFRDRPGSRAFALWSRLIRLDAPPGSATRVALLGGVGDARVDPCLLFSERAGSRAFALGSPLIGRGGEPGSATRVPLLALFCVYLVAMILTVVPASLLAQRLLRPLLARRLESRKAYFELPSGR